MKRALAAVILFFSLTGGGAFPLAAEERWKGIDESVVEKFAQEQGRQAAEPFIKVEGDLLLFFFALAGTIGGFIMGFYWHKIFVAGKKDRPEE